MSEEVTRRTLSIVLYNQHARLQQNHATRTRTPLEPPVRATLIHRATTLTSYTHKKIRRYGNTRSSATCSTASRETVPQRKRWDIARSLQRLGEIFGAWEIYECEYMSVLCRRTVRRQMEESNEHPPVSSRVPHEYASLRIFEHHHRQLGDCLSTYGVACGARGRRAR